jgi:hypothetical protein
MLTINELGYTLDSLHKIWKPKLYRIQKISIWEPESQITISFQNGSRKNFHFDILSVYTNKQKLEILKIKQ